jgi:hypothetical protein
MIRAMLCGARMIRDKEHQATNALVAIVDGHTDMREPQSMRTIDLRAGGEDEGCEFQR